MTAEAVQLVPPPQGRTVADLEALPDNGLRYELGADGRHVESARAEPGQELRLARPFPIAFDPAVLLR